MLGTTVLITGANRGVGQALVSAALDRGVARVFAGTRQPLAHPDPRVTPVDLDVTNPELVSAAVGVVGSLDILINNAGVAPYDDLSAPDALEASFAVNVFGTQRVTQAFLPLLTESKGRVVNVLSVAALAPLPMIPAYSASKAAAFNMTQSLRALLASRGVRVHGVLLGPTDTDMTRGFEIPKATPDAVAAEILDGVERGEEEIFPDPMSATLADAWRTGAVKELERAQATLVAG